MEKTDFSKRLTELRINKDVSAREMSLSIGLSEGFINKIENGGPLPNMTNFLYICDYLGISPRDFFDFEAELPANVRELCDLVKTLPGKQVDGLIALVKSIKE